MGIHAEHEERMLEATAGLEGELSPEEEERVARMNTQALEGIGMGL